MTGSLVNILMSGIFHAAILFLVSAGLSLVFGILRVVNFAHGVFYMLGAYLGFTTVALSGAFWPALVVVPLVVGTLGALLESSTLRFIYRRPPIYQLLLTFGFALILEESVRVLYGNTAKGIEPPALLQGVVVLGSNVYPRYRLFLVVLGLAVGGVVWLLLQKTRAGLVIRAVAQNSEMADCLGADVARVRTLVFGAACALAGLGGVALHAAGLVRSERRGRQKDQQQEAAKRWLEKCPGVHGLASPPVKRYTANEASQCSPS